MRTDQTERRLEYSALNIRKQLLKLCSMQSIHIGGDLSIADVMTVLWQYQIHYDPTDPQKESRDRFILSKGHSSAVLSFNQAAIGCFTAEEIFKEYATDEGRFSMHSCKLVNPYVEVSTGSLGHGLSVACGIAAALRLKGNYTSKIYTVMGDGEQSEGSIWEAVMYAAHCGLDNLVGIIDFNGLEADGTLSELSGVGDIAQKYRAYGWNVLELDGNNISSVIQAFDTIREFHNKMPVVLVCHTIKGKGVCFMENQPIWHSGKISYEQYKICSEQLEQSFMQKWGVFP